MPRCEYTDFTLLCNRRGNQNCRGKLRSLKDYLGQRFVMDKDLKGSISKEKKVLSTTKDNHFKTERNF